MTAQRRDSHSTEFGLWLRDQQEIDSKKGYVATNIDYLWRNYKTGDWMYLEEKRHGSLVKSWQKMLFDLVDRLAKIDPKYHGFNYLVFENTSPEDGKIFLNGKLITKEQLLNFLQFRSV